MRHILVREHDVVLRGDVVREIVVEDQSKQSVEQCQIHLLVDLREDRLHENVALPVVSLPNVREVVDPLAPLVHEQWRRLSVCRLDPCREEPTLIGFEEQELVKVLEAEQLDVRETRHDRNLLTASVIFSTGSMS